MPTPEQQAAVRTAWRGALACFTLAAATGALFRFAAAYGLPLGLGLGNVRHAHSHLMYFGWATPLLMAMLAARLPAFSGRTAQRLVWVCLGAALLAYPPFLLFGYTPAVVGARRLPLSVMAAGLNAVAWYAFMGYYARAARAAARGARRSMGQTLLDLAVAFLGVATLGAWGLALLKPLGISDAFWSVALTHLFLDTFSEGWFVLGTLGLVWMHADPEGARPPGRSLALVCAGLPALFALALPESLAGPGLRTWARLASVLVGAGLLVNVWALARAPGRRWAGLWALPVALLAAKAAAQVGAGLWPGFWPAGRHGLRILYLHLTLLGFVTASLAALAWQAHGVARRSGVPALYAALAVVLASLLPLSGLPGLSAAWGLKAAAWASALPVAAGAWLLVQSLRGVPERPVS